MVPGLCWSKIVYSFLLFVDCHLVLLYFLGTIDRIRLLLIWASHLCILCVWWGDDTPIAVPFLCRLLYWLSVCILVQFVRWYWTRLVCVRELGLPLHIRAWILLFLFFCFCVGPIVVLSSRHLLLVVWDRMLFLRELVLPHRCRPTVLYSSLVLDQI